jgi:cytochrome c-type biogenesis protein CcmH
MMFWISIALLALAVIAALVIAVHRAKGRASLGAVVALAVPGIALGIYATTGSPEMPDQPYAARADVAERAEMDKLLGELAHKLEADPGRLDGWLLLARSRLKIGDAQAAAEAFARARKLAPDNGEIAGEFAEASIHAADGVVSPDARAALALAHEKDPRDAKALFYLGHDALEQGKHAEAIQYWVNLVAISPRNAPWIPDLSARIAAAARDGNIDLATIKPTLAPATTPTGPSTQDIRAMVDGLAKRLKDNPDDIAGWRMLARSWRVLGETAKAEEADARVKALEAKQ